MFIGYNWCNTQNSVQILACPVLTSIISCLWASGKWSACSRIRWNDAGKVILHRGEVPFLPSPATEAHVFNQVLCNLAPTCLSCFLPYSPPPTLLPCIPTMQNKALCRKGTLPKERSGLCLWLLGGDLEVFGISCLTRVSLFTWELAAHWIVYANNVISGEGFGSRVISSPSLWAGD